VDRVISGNLLERLAATDRLHGDPGLELRAVVRRLLNSFGEGFANGRSPFQGRCPASKVNDGACRENPDQLSLLASVPCGRTDPLNWVIALTRAFTPQVVQLGNSVQYCYCLLITYFNHCDCL